MNCLSPHKNQGLQTLIIGSAVLLSVWCASAAPVTSTKTVASTPTTPVAPAGTPAVTAPPYKELPDTAIAAEVNGVKISMADINSAIADIKKREPALADGSPQANAQLSQFRQDMLKDLVDFQLLLQEAKKLNVTPNPKDVDTQIWQVKAQFPSPDAYNNWLKQTGKTEEDLRQETIDNMAVEELGSQLSVDITVSDNDLQQFYTANKDKFVIPDSVLVSHILIAVDPKSTDDQKKKLQAKAQNVLKQSLSSGADFSALAQQYSDDKATASKGGSLGYLVQTDKGSWKPIVDAAFAAPPGKVIPHLVQSDFGFHIVKPMEKKPGRTLTLDEVRDDVKNVVLHQKVEERINSEVAKLRAAATIKTYI